MSEIGELEKVFIDEASEMVQLFESSILELETNPTNRNAINSAFRAVHTLKGGSASMGYTNLSKVSHSMEDLLDLIRNNQIPLTKDIVSILLEGSKILKEGLNLLLKSMDLSSEQIESFSEMIKQTIENSKSSQQANNNSSTFYQNSINTINLTKLDITNEVTEEIKKTIQQGQEVYLLDISFNPESPLKEVGVLQIVSIIKDSSQIIDSKPSLEELYSTFHIKAAFIITTDDINKAIQRINIKDLVSDIKYYKIIYEEKKQENAKETEPVEVKSSILRIESSKVDKLMNIVGELVVNRSNINENIFYLGEIISEISGRYYDVIKSIRSLSSQISVDIKEAPEEVAEKLQNYLNIISNIISVVTNINNEMVELKKRYDNLSTGIKFFNNISIEIQESVTNLRMIPIKYLFSRLPLFVREVSTQLNKEINLIIRGEETNLDKSVIDELFDPIVHIIRNCIDHGIESKEERIAKGKSPKGNIIVEAFNEGSSIIIRIRDDGRGIDFEKIRQKGIERGLLREGMEYDKEYLLSLIFLPGFSTKEEVSSLSGRGVGMDIVKSKIEKLRGNILISTGKDKGTVFTIKLPLTIAIMKVLLFEIKNIIFAIPVNSIEEAITIKREEITTFEGKSVVKIREEVIKVFSLREIYFSDNHLGEDVDVLIVSYLGKKYALVIDKFLKEEDIFLRPIDSTLISPPGVVSATILGNGRIGYVIDIGNLVSFLEKQTRSEVSTQV